MIQEQPSKTWIVLITTIISTAGVVCVAIVGLGLPFMQEYAKNYFVTSTPYVIVVTPTAFLSNSPTQSSINEISQPPTGQVVIPEIFAPPPTPLPCSTNLTWDAQDINLGEKYARIGRPDVENSWSVNADQNQQGYMQYGPYTTQINAGKHIAMWLLMIDDNSHDDFEMIRLEVNDYSANQTLLESKKITRKQWDNAWTYQCFFLPFEIDSSRIGNKLEFRIWWYGKAYIRQQRVAVQ